MRSGKKVRIISGLLLIDAEFLFSGNRYHRPEYKFSPTLTTLHNEFVSDVSIKLLRISDFF